MCTDIKVITDFVQLQGITIARTTREDTHYFDTPHKREYFIQLSTKLNDRQSPEDSLSGRSQLITPRQARHIT